MLKPNYPFHLNTLSHSDAKPSKPATFRKPLPETFPIEIADRRDFHAHRTSVCAADADSGIEISDPILPCLTVFIYVACVFRHKTEHNLPLTANQPKQCKQLNSNNLYYYPKLAPFWLYE